MSPLMQVIMIILGGIALIVLMGYSVFKFFIGLSWIWGIATLVFIGMFYYLGKYITMLQEEGYY